MANFKTRLGAQRYNARMDKIWTAYQMGLDQEAEHLARRTGLTRAACKFWMQENHLSHTMNLMQRYPGKENAECYALAAAEIEDFILAQ